MKHLTKLLSLLLSIALILSLAVTAFADMVTTTPKYTITVNNSADGHSYEAYQVFKGTLSEDGKTLSDVDWGTGVDNAGLLNALKSTTDVVADGIFKDCTDAAAVAAKLETATDAQVIAFSQTVAKHLATEP